jgi:hypothetical protein
MRNTIDGEKFKTTIGGFKNLQSPLRFTSYKSEHDRVSVSYIDFTKFRIQSERMNSLILFLKDVKSN